MSPGIPFDITEENRNGPIVAAGQPQELKNWSYAGYTQHNS